MTLFLPIPGGLAYHYVGVFFSMARVTGGSAREPQAEPPAREHVDGVPRLLVLAKAKHILDAFTIEAPELSVAEIVARTHLPVSTCSRIVRNLAYDGMLERVGDRYRIGLTIVRWASSALESRTLIADARSSLSWLRDQTGESALLCVRDGRFAVVVGLANSHHAVARKLQIGEVTPLHAGSRGKVFLAFDSGAGRQAEGHTLEAFTRNTIVDPQQLAYDVEQIRRVGYAVSHGERNDGVVGISAPIVDKSGTMLGSIGVTAPAERVNAETIARYAQFTLQAAEQISGRFGPVG